LINVFVFEIKSKGYRLKSLKPRRTRHGRY